MTAADPILRSPKGGFPLQAPKMILFDFGHTLLYEPVFDRPAGFRAVLEHCTHNPRGVTPEDLSLDYARALGRLVEASRASGCDFQDMAVKRLLYESRGLRFSLDDMALERLFWDAAGPAQPMPGVEALLKELKRRGIRSGVVSNMNFRGENLSARIRRCLPESDFEFILCSCEYATKKPRREFFQLALSKAGLPAEEVWYCGDNPRCDVLGAHGAGIFPVWYDNERSCPYRSEGDRVEVTCPCLHIREWEELTAALDRL